MIPFENNNIILTARSQDSTKHNETENINKNSLINKPNINNNTSKINKDEVIEFIKQVKEQ